VNPSSKRKPAQFEPPESDFDMRVSDRNYSNLFGREFFHPRTSKRSSDTPRSESLPSTPARKRTNAFEKLLYTPKGSQTLEIPKLNSKNLPKPSEFKTETYEISGLNSKQNESFIKSLCKDCHVVSIKPERDSITGMDKGKAILKVRLSPSSNSSSKLSSRIETSGLTMSPMRSLTKPSLLKNCPVQTPPQIQRTQSMSDFKAKLSPRGNLSERRRS